MKLAGDGGYTLTEMLVALLIVGLAMGGLMQASALIGHLQDQAQIHLKNFEAGRRLQLAFSGLLDGRGPFLSTSDDFDGDATSFHFQCGDAVCGAQIAGKRLQLETPARAILDLDPGAPGSTDGGHFEYAGTQTRGDSWPPEGHDVQRLAAVTLVGGPAGRTPLVSTQIWRQEQAHCQFDVIAKDCRGLAP